MSASSIVQYGPDSTRVKSNTVVPDSGASLLGIELKDGVRDHRIHRIALTEL